MNDEKTKHKWCSVLPVATKIFLRRKKQTNIVVPFATLKCIDQFHGVMQKRCTTKLSLIFRNNENAANEIITVVIFL